MTPQENALALAKKRFGTTAFTEDHVNYRRVAFRTGGKTISALGDTWAKALAALAKKQVPQ